MKKKENNVFFCDCPQFLKKINGIHFTDREIDILAFLVSGRSGKKIAHCLSISPKTVENHTRNLMGKIECNSRESIIDFVEKSNALFLLRKHYTQLLDRVIFEKNLQIISKLHLGANPSCSLICFQKQQMNDLFISQLEIHLKLAGLSTSIKLQESYKSFFQLIEKAGKDEFTLYVVNKDLANRLGDFSKDQNFSQSHDKVLLLLPETEDGEEYDLRLPYLNYNFESYINYYKLFFKIIEKIFSDIDFEKVIPKFNERDLPLKEHLLHNPLETYSEKNIPKNKNKKTTFIDWNNLKNKKLFFLSLCFGLFFLAIGFFQIIENSQFISYKDKKKVVRPNLHIPSEALLLDRRDLMVQIEDKFKDTNRDRIATVEEKNNRPFYYTLLGWLFLVAIGFGIGSIIAHRNTSVLPQEFIEKMDYLEYKLDEGFRKRNVQEKQKKGR